MIRIEVQGDPGVHQFHKRIGSPDTMEIQRNLGLELGVKGIQGFTNFINELDFL